MKNLILTEGARRALERAVDLATKFGSAVITPTHLLCSILDEESPAQVLLEESGVDPAAIPAAGLTSEKAQTVEDPVAAVMFDRVQDNLREMAENAVDKRPPESLELESAIAFAQRTATREGEFVEVSSTHLVAGLLKVESPVAELLRQHGVTEELLGVNRRCEEVLAKPMAVDFEIKLETHPASSSPEGAENGRRPDEERRNEIAKNLAGTSPQPSPLQGGEGAKFEKTDALRILDAAANRAREGLRVVEDFVRFTLDDGHLSEKLKTLRHQLREIMERLDGDALMQSRDTQGDVGTTISTSQEMSRSGLQDVAKAGLKRAQEATRTLEEFSKTVAIPRDGESMPEQFALIRYGLYTLEKAILTIVSSAAQLEGRSLYLLLTKGICQLGWETVLREAIAGGVGIVQVREKSMADAELLAHARQVRELTRESGTHLIMNDRPDLAVLAGCDGVHVGQEELSVRDVRRIVGPDLLVGVSTHSIEQARQAVLDGASYIGVGPTFPSHTKQFEEFAGLELVQQVSEEISLPAFPIGGIVAANLDAVLATGATRVAVSGAVCRSEDPRRAAGDLCEKLARR